MENKIRNYKARIESLLKEDNKEAVLEAIDALTKHSFQLGRDSIIPEEKFTDDIIHPAKYMSYVKDGIECIDAMRHGLGLEETSHYCLGRAFCLLWKNENLTDIRKAIWFLNKYLNLNKMTNE